MKLVDIEKLLQWAYRDELPKQTVGELSGWERRMYLGFDENPNAREHEAEMPIALGPPHPDALTLEWVVRGIPDDRLPDGANRSRLLFGIAPQWPGAQEPMKAETGALIAMHARMGTRPPWSVGQIRALRVIGKNGKPVVEGVTAGRRYAEGARCPLRLDPPAREIVFARYEYAAWHAALVKLANESWIMRDHKPIAPRAPAEPWTGSIEPEPVIHRGPAAAILPTRERVYAGPRQRRKFSPVTLCDIRLTTPNEPTC